MKAEELARYEAKQLLVQTIGLIALVVMIGCSVLDYLFEHRIDEAKKDLPGKHYAPVEPVANYAIFPDNELLPGGCICA